MGYYIHLPLKHKTVLSIITLSFYSSMSASWNNPRYSFCILLSISQVASSNCGGYIEPLSVQWYGFGVNFLSYRAYAPLPFGTVPMVLLGLHSSQSNEKYHEYMFSIKKHKTHYVLLYWV